MELSEWIAVVLFAYSAGATAFIVRLRGRMSRHEYELTTAVSLVERLKEWQATAMSKTNVVPESVWEIVTDAEEVCRHEDQTEGVSGEYRRHRAYAKLLKAYPDAPKWHIGLAVEIAVQRLREIPQE